MHTLPLLPPPPPQKTPVRLGLLLCAYPQSAPPTSAGEDARAQEQASRAANQAKLLAAGVLDALASVALRGGGVSSTAVRTQVRGAEGRT